MTALSSATRADDRVALGAVPLAAELQQRLQRAAAGAGLSPDLLAAQLLSAGLERFEAEQAAALAAGRCSLRTGSCTAGPLPLPVQQ